MTLHSALKPHESLHGFLHFLSMQALLESHSALVTHSGRQPGGTPIYVCKHEQTA